MSTTVVGFRLGKAATSRQVTVLVTQSGVLHRSHGVYGQPPKLEKPKLPLRYLRPDLPWMQGEHVLTGPISALRGHHATALKNGYGEVLVPPACVLLDVEERPLPPRNNPRVLVHPELTEAFLGSAPHTAQPLDSAVDAFRAALGLPVRQRGVTWRPRQTAVPPRIEAMLRTLAHGTEIASPDRLGVGWSVTPEAVTLFAGRTVQALDRQAVLELQGALTAWLRLTQPPPS
ncbi:hypothetical protein ACFRJ1_15990 [Streptomyces sp. NPDC056773]|uniref:hypothetical protein n=1 Tax=unclassified Streptomyces TaxID=2593676 RepID=UPI00368788DA